MDKWSGTRKSAIKYYLGSLICITVAIGCYESMLLLFIIGILLLLYLRAFTDNRRLKSGYVIGQLIIGASITLGVIILRSVILKVMIQVFRLQDMVGFMNQRSITEVLKIFGSNQPIQELWMLLKDLDCVLCECSGIFAHTGICDCNFCFGHDCRSAGNTKKRYMVSSSSDGYDDYTFSPDHCRRKSDIVSLLSVLCPFYRYRFLLLYLFFQNEEPCRGLDRHILFWRESSYIIRRLR